MFYVQCRKCKSKDVHHYRYKENTNTLNQFCGACRTNLTQKAANKAKRTRMANKTSRNRANSAPRKHLNRPARTFSVLALFLLGWAFSAFAFESSKIVYVATANELPKVEELEDEPTKEEIAIEKIKFYAAKYKVSSKEMYAVVSCETAGTFDPTIRSRYLEGTPRHEKSFGLSQIHLRSHPYVSYEQAIDPDFSLDFMAKNFAKGKQGMWSCWKILKKQGVL